eukprot:gene41833-55489_t
MPVGDGCGLNASLLGPQPVAPNPLATPQSQSRSDRHRHHPLAAVLRTVGPGSCPGQFNFHCHTHCSDGSLRPEELAHQALAMGLGCLVHVLALGYTYGHPSLDPYLQGAALVGKALRAEAVLEAIWAAGGLALLAHPARYRLPFHDLLEAADQLGFDGAEAWYDYQMQTRWQPTPHICEAIAK